LCVLFEGFFEVSAELIIEGDQLVNFSGFTCQLILVLAVELSKFKFEIIICSLELEKVSTEFTSFLCGFLKIGIRFLKQ
jgi:hypothetical protein